MAYVSELIIYPIKGLCGIRVNEMELDKWGGIGIKDDREYAMYDKKTGCYVNGKQNPKIFRIRVLKYEKPCTLKLLNISDNDEIEVNLKQNLSKAEEWLSKVLGKEVIIKYTGNQESSFTDDPRFDGPTIISQKTLEKVAGWFEISETETLDRFRPNIVIDGVDAFWEDNLVAQNEKNGVKFKIGSCEMVGLYPVHR